MNKKIYISPLLMLFSILLIFQANTSWAATINVNTADDELNTDGDCSLREAIEAANTNAIVDTCTAGTGPPAIEFINLTVPGSYVLSQAGYALGLPINDDITINGLGVGTTIIDDQRSGPHRVFIVDALSGGTITLTVNDAIIQGGNVDGDGGGFWVAGDAKLVLNRCTVRNNHASNRGGAIFVEQDTGAGTLWVFDSTISENSSLFNGGGIYIDQSSNADIKRTTISANQAGGDGGGLCNDGDVLLTNVTVSGNESDLVEPNQSGGGLYNSSRATLDLMNVTVAYNTAHNSVGGGIYNGNSTEFAVTIINTIVAHNTGGNCGGPGANGTGFNLSNDDTCTSSFFTAPSDINGAAYDPLLGALQNNGGPTFTHALLMGSPAIDTGTESGAPSQDQRSFTRPVDVVGFNNDGASNITDRGAFERQLNEGLSIPSLTQWGMIIFMALAGLGAVYYIRRQRKTER